MKTQALYTIRLLSDFTCFMMVLAMFVIVAEVKMVQASVDVQPGQGGFEPHNAVVNPLNPSQVAVMRGCTLRIDDSFGQGNFTTIWSTNAASCRGDPSIAFDSQGRLFVTHLSNDPGEQSVMAAQIPAPILAGGNYTPILVSSVNGIGDDKQWLVADFNPLSPFRDNLYIVWTELGGGIAGAWQIMFSMSIDQGANWSPAQALSPVDNDGDGAIDEDPIDGIDNDGDTLIDEDPPEGNTWPSHAAVSANGDIYIAYKSDSCGPAGAGTTVLLRDGSGGVNLASGIVEQASTPFGPGQATMTCNRQDDAGDPSLGDIIPNVDFWLIGTVQPWVLPDPLYPNKVYVVSNDDPNNAFGIGDDGDVVIARSTDFGNTFTHGRVDHDPGQSLAVMPTAHIDQDGNIVVSWYTTRTNLMNTGSLANDGNPNFLLDLYGTTSNDGGETFINDFRISDQAFDPDVNKGPGTSGCRFGSMANVPPDCTARIGEYNGLWTVDGIGYATWTGNGTSPVPPFPSDGTGGMLTYFDLFSMAGAFPDRLEPNESIDFAVVAALGADNTYNEPNLSIHSATDVDFFKVIALHTGKLEVEIEFNEVIAELQVLIQDANGNEIAAGAMNTIQIGSSVAMRAIPVVQGETYFVEVIDSNAPNEFPPQSSYDLTIVNRAAPIPTGIDLLASSDSGHDNSDDLTNDNTPTIQVHVDFVDAIDMGIDILTPAEVAAGDDGYAVAMFVDGVLDGYAVPVSAGQIDWEYTFNTLADDTPSLTAKVQVFDGATPQNNGFGGEADPLIVSIDTVSPASPSIPDLLASSDSAGIIDDNVTRIQSPAFVGTGEGNTLIRIFANGGLVGQGVVTSGGAYEVTVEPLVDEVYDITATLEDWAGNISSPSAALVVTIANQVLNLEGGTVLPANAPVVINMSLGTVAGYPGAASASGLIGIVGIPEVNLNANAQDVTILGSSSPDGINFIPIGTGAGTVTRDGSVQRLNFSNIGSTFTIDPIGGSDIVSVFGTSGADTVTVLGNSNTTVQVNSMQTLTVPIVNVERLVINSGHSVDNIDITVFDTVNANMFVDAEQPTSNKPNGDILTVRDGSGKAKMKKQPGGPVPNSGSILVTYDRTTGNATRVDYANTEKIKVVH